MFSHVVSGPVRILGLFAFPRDALARVLLQIMNLELSMWSRLLIHLCLIICDSLCTVVSSFSLMECLTPLTLLFVLLFGSSV